MRDLSEKDVVSIHGGKSVLSKAINVIGGSLITGLVEGFAGFMVAGPSRVCGWIWSWCVRRGCWSFDLRGSYGINRDASSGAWC